jgi:hypothetical protein
MEQLAQAAIELERGQSSSSRLIRNNKGQFQQRPISPRFARTSIQVADPHHYDRNRVELTFNDSNRAEPSGGAVGHIEFKGDEDKMDVDRQSL